MTLEWREGGPNSQCAATKAYELQWRTLTENGKPKNWETGQQLILRSTCRKRNLRPGSCYEFRVRAASVSGWSAHSDKITVVTLSEFVADENSERRKSNNNKPDSNVKQFSTEHVHLPKVDPKEMSARTTETARHVAEPWKCVVCKRNNMAVAAKCSVCGTRKNYDWNHKDNQSQRHSANPRDNNCTQKAARLARKTKQDGGDKDGDDYGIDGKDPLGGTWTFSDKDVPERYNAYDDIDQWGEDPSLAHLRQETKGETLWLNPAVTCLHNVRQEPISNSPVVGYLVADTEVRLKIRQLMSICVYASGLISDRIQIQVVAETGNWIKCKFHKANKPQDEDYAAAKCGEGWCLKYDSDHQYIVEDSFAYPSRQSSKDGEEELIYELRDESGQLYYFNCYTGVSMWEPPE